MNLQNAIEEFFRSMGSWEAGLFGFMVGVLLTAAVVMLRERQ